MVPEVVQLFWAAMARGEFVTTAAAEAGTYREMGTRWLAAAGGVRPRRGRDLKGRCVTFAEREEIAFARPGVSRCARSPGGWDAARRRSVASWRATAIERVDIARRRDTRTRAYGRASRPKPAKLAVNLMLRGRVEEDLRRRYSPEQIVGRLRRHSLTIWRCGCLPRRSINRCMSSRAGRCGAI
jgi:transposase, IS30 family